jgi:two-component system response regulator VanR
MRNNLLIIDDDRDIGEMLCSYFSKNGYDTVYASNGKYGLELYKKCNFSLIILDIMMPEMDGYAMLKKLREISDVPVILLTAKAEPMDKVTGFIMGCDDYVVKPFDFMELSLRISAILKRTTVNQVALDNVIRVKDIEINTDEFSVKREGNEIILTAKEYAILYTLASNKGRLYSSKMLYELLWKETFMETDNTVIMHIKNLREKIGDTVKDSRYIKTIWGMGYKIEKDI